MVAFYNATFGEYNVGVLDTAGHLVNSTTVNLFQDQNASVNCNLFDLSISVTVTDYFGQPFGNTNVTLLESGGEAFSSLTQGNGVVTFPNLVGNSYSVSVYLSDKGSAVAKQSLFVDGSTSVSIKVGRYVLLFGDPVEMTEFAAVLLILVVVVVVLLLEVFFMMRRKRQRAEG
jgi:hypothetical protein